jgi:short chain dehydrogenase
VARGVVTYEKISVEPCVRQLPDIRKHYEAFQSEPSMQNFQSRYGPWALVAGASEGLGAAWATALAKEKLNLILVARRSIELEALAAQLRQQTGVEVKPLVLDLAQPSEVTMQPWRPGVTI